MFSKYLVVLLMFSCFECKTAGLANFSSDAPDQCTITIVVLFETKSLTIFLSPLLGLPAVNLVDNWVRQILKTTEIGQGK